MEKVRKGKEPPDPKILKTFSENLSASISTNSSLAVKIGVSEQSVADYVNGVSLPRADILCKISEAIGKPMEWLLRGNSGPSCHVNCDEKLQPLCEKVKEVIQCKWSYSTSLMQNIDSFHEAVREREEREKREGELTAAKKRHKKEIADLQSKVENLTKVVENFTKIESDGQRGGTADKPARRTAEDQKAG